MWAITNKIILTKYKISGTINIVKMVRTKKLKVEEIKILEN